MLELNRKKMKYTLASYNPTILLYDSQKAGGGDKGMGSEWLWVLYNLLRAVVYVSNCIIRKNPDMDVGIRCEPSGWRIEHRFSSYG